MLIMMMDQLIFLCAQNPSEYHEVENVLMDVEGVDVLTMVECIKSAIETQGEHYEKTIAVILKYSNDTVLMAVEDDAYLSNVCIIPSELIIELLQFARTKGAKKAFGPLEAYLFGDMRKM